MTPRTTPPTTFDWTVYADATFAGLSVLIPIPLIDLAFEWFFRRRMPGTIAKRNGRILPPAAIHELNRGRGGCWQGCLMWPLTLVFKFLKRLSRKILYFLTVKEAIDQLSHYWRRAFLLNYMVTAGYLEQPDKVALAVNALDQVLAVSNESPLTQLARQVVARVSHVLRTLVRWARRREEDEVVAATRSRMAQTWDSFADYLSELATLYDETYDRLATQALFSTDPTSS